MAGNSEFLIPNSSFILLLHSPPMYEHEQQVASDIVAEVCSLARRVQDQIAAASDSVTKSDRSPVTLADLATQVVVSRRLMDAFPGDPLLAEESSDAFDNSPNMASRVHEQIKIHIPDITRESMVEALDRGDHAGESGRYWVLDPIDGTKGFLRGDQYAIALALVDAGRVVVGVLGCPNLPASSANAESATGYLFSARIGEGTIARSIDASEGHAIQTDDISNPAEAVLCESVEAAHAAHSVQGRIASSLGISAPSYRIDSQCKYAVVARGDASIYLRLPRDATYREKVWDHAAGSLVVEEAGGRVTDLQGHSLDFSKGRLLGNGQGIVCTNGAIHDQVLAACRAELGLN
jgi:HAL2 family 3'(2'),5'-bisphosphate nucleotidase